MAPLRTLLPYLTAEHDRFVLVQDFEDLLLLVEIQVVCSNRRRELRDPSFLGHLLGERDLRVTHLKIC